MDGAGWQVSWRLIEVVESTFRVKGMDPVPLLQELGLPVPGQAETPRRVPHAVAMGLLDAALRSSGEPSFGLLAAVHHRPGAVAER